jgi:hypothetical protein
MVQDVLLSSWYSLMLDESYDKGWRAQVVTSIRFVLQGKVATRFYSINELRRRTITVKGKDKAVTAGSALSIAYAIRQQVLDTGLSFSRLAFWATDGANAMLGAKSGLSAIFREWCKAFALNYHCIAHRHALANSSHVLREFSAYVENIMKLILSYFARSGDRRAILQELQDEMGLKHMTIVKFHAIRWLSRASVLVRLVYNYAALREQWDRDLQQLKEKSKHKESDPEGAKVVLNIIREVETHKWVGSLAVMTDMVVQQSVVNQIFQKDVVRFKVVTETIDQAIQELEESYLNHDAPPGGTEYNLVRTAMLSKKPLSEYIKDSERRVRDKMKSSNAQIAIPSNMMQLPPEAQKGML